MSPTPCKAEEIHDFDEVPGPCLYSIQRNVVLENDLETLLSRAVELLKREICDDLLSAGFYNSIHHPSKAVLGISVNALAVYDWELLMARLQDTMSSSEVVIIRSRHHDCPCQRTY
jgi:hypothetical protein